MNTFKNTKSQKIIETRNLRPFLTKENSFIFQSASSQFRVGKQIIGKTCSFGIPTSHPGSCLDTVYGRNPAAVGYDKYTNGLTIATE